MGPLTDEMKRRAVDQQGDIRYDITWTTLAEYLAFLEKKGISTNVASYIGAATIREHVVGLDDRKATPEELEKMRALVRQEMAAGALGIGSSLIYAPGTYAKTDEIVALAKVLHERFTIKKAWMTTVHSYTNDQNLLDLPHKDLRRARAAALSIIPTTTGAALAVGEVLPEIKGRLDGISMRVPTPNVSVVDLAVLVDKKTSKEEVNAAFKTAADGKLKGLLEYTEEELVSIDFRGNPHSSIVDSSYTSVMDGDFIKVLSWYDNEWGYSNRCVDLIRYLVKKGL